MEGLIRDRLAYCDSCNDYRPFFEAAIPEVEEHPKSRPASEYVCAICSSIIGTFEHVTPEEFATAAEAIEDPKLKKLLAKG